jgi:Helix-turn-helix domain
MSLMELTRPSIARDLQLTPQAKKILGHLQEHGTITPLKAERVYGCRRLAARIFELKEAGYKVDRAIKFDEAGQSYGHYTLIKAVN